jgi:hypothetical protein
MVLRSPPEAQFREMPILSEGQYLGLFVSPEEVTIDTRKLKAIWKRLT